MIENDIKTTDITHQMGFFIIKQGGRAMKRFYLAPRVIAITPVIICLLLAQTGMAQNSDTLNVDEAFICRKVVDRKVVDPGTNFPSSIGELYCYTKILGAKAATRITHVWYHGNVERARVDLPVKASHWRTFSKKIIRPVDIGVWHVDILDAAGNRLEVLNFHIDKP